MVMEAAFRARGNAGPEDLAFHLSIYEASGNPLFGQLLEQMRGAFETLFSQSKHRPDFASRSFPMHRALFEAIARRDADEARHQTRLILDIVARGSHRHGARRLGMNVPVTPATRPGFARAQAIVAHDEMQFGGRGGPAAVPDLAVHLPLGRRDDGDLRRARAPAGLLARTEPDRAGVSRRRSQRSRAPRTPSASPQGWRRSPLLCCRVVSPGDRLVSVTHVYPDAYRFFETLLTRFGVTVSYVDPADEAAVVAALPGAAVFYLESPTQLDDGDERPRPPRGAGAGARRRHHRRQQLGDARAAAAGGARLRSRRALGFEISRRPFGRGGRRGRRLGRAESAACAPTCCLTSAASSPPSRPGCCCAASGHCRPASRSTSGPRSSSRAGSPAIRT